jgi:hypothetical protein
MKFLARIATLFLVQICIASADPDPGVQQPIYGGNGDFQLAPRSALVIGVDKLADNSGIVSLKNPRQDASVVSDALRKAGFLVTNLAESYPSEQMTKQNIKKAIYDFAETLHSIGGVGLIYYSGHGVERAGKMYLFPYDSYVRFDRDFEEELISMAFLNAGFAFANNPLNILVIDACRDFPGNLQVDSFGASATAASNSQASNVVVAYSTLSGDKALDGTGSLSPYARAFADAFIGPDRGLSDFFGSIGIQLYTTLHPDTLADVANQNFIAGRDFIFVPTKASYTRERDIYNRGTGAGSRPIIEGLRWQYSGGYFYNAATKWLKDAPLAPAAPVANSAGEVRIAEVLSESNLRRGPSIASGVVATVSAGTRLPVAGQPVTELGSHWLPVRVSETSGEIAYLRNDRAKVAKTTSIPLEFDKIADDGTVKLNDKSVDDLRKAIAASGPSIVGTSVVGSVSNNPKDAPASNREVLAKQAATIIALKELGVDTTKTGVVFKGVAGSISKDSVSVELDAFQSH